MSGTTIGILGGVLGTIIGLGGGVLGTWSAIRNTANPAERAFVVRFCALSWGLMLLLFLAPLGLLLAGAVPGWAYWGCFSLLWAVWLPLILWANRRQAALRSPIGRPGT